MSNNTSDFPSCQQNPSFTSAVDIIIIVLNRAVLPLYFTFSLTGHFLCLRAYYRKSKSEQAYLNQIFVTVSETFQIFGSSIVVAFQGLWAFGNGPDWFQRCYFCMSYLARYAGAIENTCTSITLFLTLSMAADRLFAIWKPHVYKFRRHRRDHVIVALNSVMLGVLINVYQFFQSKAMDIGDGRYTVAMATVDMSPCVALVVTTFAELRVGIRLLVTVCLILCNVALTNAYYQRTKKLQQMAHSKDRKQKNEEEKTLLLLSIVQSLYLCVGMAMHGCMVTLVYAVPTFFSCGYKIMSPATEIVLQGGDIAVFCSMMAMRPHYRKMIMAEIPCLANKIGPDHTHDGTMTTTK